MPIVEFYKDLRNHHADGTVNVYPAMLILIAVLIPYNILISNVSAINKHTSVQNGRRVRFQQKKKISESAIIRARSVK